MFNIKYLHFFSRWLAGTLLLSAGWAVAQKLSHAAPFSEASEALYGSGAGGKLSVFGGLAPGWKRKGLVYAYDPAKDVWIKKKNMPIASHYLALAEMNGKIYLFAGFDSDVHEVIDPEAK